MKYIIIKTVKSVGMIFFFVKLILETGQANPPQCHPFSLRELPDDYTRQDLNDFLRPVFFSFCLFYDNKLA